MYSLLGKDTDKTLSWSEPWKELRRQGKSFLKKGKLGGLKNEKNKNIKERKANNDKQLFTKLF